MNIWPYIIALALIFLYRKRGALTQIFRYRRMKKVYDKTNSEFISLKVQDINLKMEDTINIMNNIVENLEAFRPHLHGHKLNMTENLIQKTIELQEEYAEIKDDMNKSKHNQESLEAIDSRLDVFVIRLNNELLVRVRQLKSKIKSDKD